MGPIRASVIVSGRVQGVLFRDHTRSIAKKLGITGWVRNLLDGTVQIACEGNKNEVEQFIQAVKKGPPLAKVEDVSVEYGKHKGEWIDFEVREFGF